MIFAVRASLFALLTLAVSAADADIATWLSGKTLAQAAEERQRDLDESAPVPSGRMEGNATDVVVINLLAGVAPAAQSLPSSTPEIRETIPQPAAAAIPPAWRVVLDTARNDGERALLAVLLACGDRLRQQRGIPLPATIAMALHESGYGRSSLARDRHNYFGLKARAMEDFINLPTKELGIMVRANFRVFTDLQEGIEGFGEFISRPHYRRAFVGARPARDFIATLLACKYCPEKDYMECIDVIMRRHKLDLLEPPTAVATR